MNDHIARPVKFEALFATLVHWVHPADAITAVSVGVSRDGTGAAAS